MESTSVLSIMRRYKQKILDHLPAFDDPERRVGSSGTAGWIIWNSGLDHPGWQVGSSGTAGWIIRNGGSDHPERQVGSSGTAGWIIRNGGLDDEIDQDLKRQSLDLILSQGNALKGSSRFLRDTVSIQSKFGFCPQITRIYANLICED